MKYLLILSFLSICYIAESQCCPYINNIEIIPAAPTTIDNVKIVTTVTTPNQGAFLYSMHSINGNTIDIEACYFSGLLTATQTFYDTLDIGLLGAGNYTVDLTAYQSLDTICDYEDTTTSMMNFTVIEHIVGTPSVKFNLGKLYPNPTSGSFNLRLPDGIIATDFYVHSISGEVVYHGVYAEEISVNLESGIYLIQLVNDTTILGYHRILIL